MRTNYFKSRPGFVDNQTCLIPFSSTFGVGFLNGRWWYHTRSVLFVLFLTIPLAWYMTGLTSVDKSTWMSQRRFCIFLIPVKIHWSSLLYNLTKFSDKVAVHPVLHIFPIDNRLDELMLLKTLAVAASFGRSGMSSCALSDQIISAPLGKISLNVGAFSVHMEVCCMRYMLEAPVSGLVVIILGGAISKDWIISLNVCLLRLVATLLHIAISFCPLFHASTPLTSNPP